MAAPRIATRSLLHTNNAIFGLACELNPAVLPSYGDVMRCFDHSKAQLKLANKTKCNPSIYEVCTIVAEAVVQIWRTASIPTMTMKNIEDKIKKYYNQCFQNVYIISRHDTEYPDVTLTLNAIVTQC